LRHCEEQSEAAIYTKAEFLKQIASLPLAMMAKTLKGTKIIANR